MHLLHFLPLFTQFNSYLPHILLKITSFLLHIWSTIDYEASVLSLVLNRNRIFTTKSQIRKQYDMGKTRAAVKPLTEACMYQIKCKVGGGQKCTKKRHWLLHDNCTAAITWFINNKMKNGEKLFLQSTS